MITTTLGQGGRVDLYNFTGSVHLIADVAGYLVPASANAGTVGPQGPAGPQGPSGFAGAHVVLNPYIMEPGDVETFVNTECPEGEVVLGGGYATFNEDIMITASTPIEPVDGPPTAWSVAAETRSGQPITELSSINVRIVCAAAP
jgi:hypothetical protein